jgi:Na+/melibiose symporter-like transporter
VTFSRRLLYLAGQLGMMGVTRYLLMWIVDFANTTPEGASSASSAGTAAAVLFVGVGAVMFGFRIFDGVTDPLAGMLSDAWVRRGRQRRGLLWFSFLVPPIGVALVFAPHHGMPPSLRWTLLIAGMFIFFVGYTFYAIPYWSLIDDYAGEGPESQSERRVLSNILGAGMLLATGVGFVVSPILVQNYGFFAGAIAFAIPATVLMTLPYFACPPELAKAPPKPPDPNAPGLLDSLKEAFTHRRFVAVLIMFAGSQMSFTVMTSAAPFIARDLLGGTRADVAKILGPFLLTAIPFFLVAPRISAKLGWEKAVIVASIALGVVYGLTGGLGQALIGSATTTAMILFALGGPMAALLLGLEGEAIMACARERGREDAISIYFGVYNFIVKALNGLAIALADYMANLAKSPEYGVGAVRGMSLAAGGLLVVSVGVYFLFRPRASAPAA